jgi:hypothetical protein
MIGSGREQPVVATYKFGAYVTALGGHLDIVVRISNIHLNVA